MADSDSDGCSCLFTFLACIAWPIYMCWVAPRIKEDKFDLPSSMVVEMAVAFPNDGTVTYERRTFGNLCVYMQKKEFESVPYPEREKVVERIFKTWGEPQPWYWFSGVTIKDIQSGNTLATYSCNYKSASLAKHWFQSD